MFSVVLKDLHVQLFCNPMDYSPLGSSVYGIIHTRILEWVIISSSRGSSQPRDQTYISCVSCLEGGFFTIEPSGGDLMIYLSF